MCVRVIASEPQHGLCVHGLSFLPLHALFFHPTPPPLYADSTRLRMRGVAAVVATAAVESAEESIHKKRAAGSAATRVRLQSFESWDAADPSVEACLSPIPRSLAIQAPVSVLNLY